jgi:hypothetical protein
LKEKIQDQMGIQVQQMCVFDRSSSSLNLHYPTGRLELSSNHETLRDLRRRLEGPTEAHMYEAASEKKHLIVYVTGSVLGRVRFHMEGLPTLHLFTNLEDKYTPRDLLARKLGCCLESLSICTAEWGSEVSDVRLCELATPWSFKCCRNDPGTITCTDKKTPGLEEDNTRFNIHLRTLTGKTYTLEVHAFLKIRDLKKKILEDVGTPAVEQQRLIFAARELEDARTLLSYKINSGSTVNLVLRLRGGMFHPSSGRTGFSPLPALPALSAEEGVRLRALLAEAVHQLALSRGEAPEPSAEVRAWQSALGLQGQGGVSIPHTQGGAEQAEAQAQKEQEAQKAEGTLHGQTRPKKVKIQHK